MTMLANIEKKEILTLADYEARIHLYKEQIGIGYIGIGRTLLDAKDAKVVPHGTWETWVTSTTGLNIQQAQRCMRAAREIKDGSALAKLEMSKALLLLSSGLDEETRESIAQQAADEGATIKQLRAEIERTQDALDSAQRIAAAETKRVTEAKLEALDAKEAMEAAQSALYEASRENDQLRGRLEGIKDYIEDQKARAADIARQKAEADFQNNIKELKQELAAAEAREERRAAEMEQLRHEHQQRAMDDARGLCTSTLTGFDLAAAVRAFIGSAGVLPQMGPTLRSASPAEREAIRQNIDTVDAWVYGARIALGIQTVDAEAAVVE